jgi:hypothetical protein
MAKRRVASLLIAGVLAAPGALAQWFVPWTQVPTVVVVGVEGDPRRPLVDDAVSFWNALLEQSGSGFRIGPVVHVNAAVPEDALRSLSAAVVGRPADPGLVVPESLRDLPGALTVFLGDSEFVSFAALSDAGAKRVVGIRGARHPPMNLPNVARNVIAHELGHAIGLGHNRDRSKLMCGRPAECRPAVFRSDEPRYFPVADDEKQQLLGMYPSGWQPSRPERR